jgi:hypothetical protein
MRAAIFRQQPLQFAKLRQHLIEISVAFAAPAPIGACTTAGAGASRPCAG